MALLYAVNVCRTYLCMSSALGPMLRSGDGMIVNMASIAATAGLADRFAYSMNQRCSIIDDSFSRKGIYFTGHSM
jgi:2-keto-3-deoxy-L-fuconate dehydrogenase